MKENLSKMKNDNPNNVIISADKSRNYYLCESEKYEKLLTENVTKVYKKASETDLHEVNCEAAKIARSLL